MKNFQVFSMFFSKVIALKCFAYRESIESVRREDLYERGPRIIGVVGYRQEGTKTIKY